MLTTKRITGMDSPWFAEVDALYERAFPLHEQREPDAKKSALANERYALLAWFDDHQFIGLTGSWCFAEYSYIEHLAVNDKLRSQGYGKRILNHLLEQQPLTILEIDPLTTEIAHKRLRFYQSLGFYENAWPHFHPSYHEGMEDHQLIVLSYPQPVSAAQYQRFSNDLRHVVMEKE
ncbi:N-acetyltransferase [Enterobacteriaceae bacterium 89]|nr:N-acetyltransferase [Enterobacteriaceae bacterium 89]